MARLILIETSTSLCSAAISENGRIIAYRESSELRSHAALTAPFIKEMLDQTGFNAGDCDAVCVSSGPGSYTGLRVGSSTAKGLCFGSGIPLIAVNTPEILLWKALDKGLLPEDCKSVVTMIDARRMEIYSATFSPNGSRKGEIAPVIVDKDSFSEELSEGPVLFIGDGADKCKDVLANANAHFYQTCPDAEAMLHPAEKAFDEKRFEDIAYFEPFYLKEFVATVSRKQLF